MKRIQLQGLMFCLLAVLTVLASRFFAPAEPFSALVLVASLIFLLGVPHGALDPIFAQKLMSISGWRSWLKFISGYLGLVGISVVTWWQFPLFFMSVFLLISVLHFSKDLTFSTPMISRMLHGGAVIVLPAHLHGDQLLQLFSLILNDADGLKIADFLHLLVWPWTIGMGIAIGIELPKRWRSALEMMAIVLLSTFADPLIGFTVYFCCMHSLRHILRAKRYSGAGFGQLLLISLAPMAGTLVIALGCWMYFPPSSDTARLLQIVFVLLAALTLPHMLLIHRVEYAD